MQGVKKLPTFPLFFRVQVLQITSMKLLGKSCLFMFDFFSPDRSSEKPKYRKAIKVHLAYAMLNPLAAANVGLINIKMKWRHTSCILLGVENLYSFVTEARFARGGGGGS